MVVIIPISIKRTINWFSIDLNIVLLNEANNSTIAIFMKLFATKIVANNRFGFFNNDITLLIDCVNSASSVSSNDFICREKKATSAPDINAELINKKSTKVS